MRRSYKVLKIPSSPRNNPIRPTNSANTNSTTHLFKRHDPRFVRSEYRQLSPLMPQSTSKSFIMASAASIKYLRRFTSCDVRFPRG